MVSVPVPVHAAAPTGVTVMKPWEVRYGGYGVVSTQYVEFGGMLPVLPEMHVYVMPLKLTMLPMLYAVELLHTVPFELPRFIDAVTVLVPAALGIKREGLPE